MTDPVTGVSKGYGFVRFSLEADLQSCPGRDAGRCVLAPPTVSHPGVLCVLAQRHPRTSGPGPALAGPNGPIDPHQQHLQMPRPHNPAQSAGPSFLHGGAPSGGSGARSEVVSPQPHIRQQSSPTNPASLVSPISPIDGVGNGNMPVNSSVHSMRLPGQQRRRWSAGLITCCMLRSHTPSSAPPPPQQQQPGACERQSRRQRG